MTVRFLLGSLIFDPGNPYHRGGLPQAYSSDSCCRHFSSRFRISFSYPWSEGS